jgi:UDP-N-acetylmuramoyl-L-alanyl-D-glutamate--2,6-diaminopimelate ligase
MRLSELIAALPPELAPAQPLGGGDPVVRGIKYDSRDVAPGDLFVALRGAAYDGHGFVEQAVAHGAVALLVEALPERAALEDRVAVSVPDTRRALGPIAECFFGAPARELQLVGVTGTNGKTSTTYLIESMLTTCGRRCGLIGTVEIRYADERLRAINTTPESLDLQRTLRDMRTRGVEIAVLEVSSHGLALGRVHGCRFAVGAVTNVTREHLDFHGTMDEYRDAKAALFRDHLSPDGVAVINLDDSSADDFTSVARAAGARLVRITRDARRPAEVALLDADVRLEGSRARVRLPDGELELELPLVGDFNLENLLVATGVAVALGLDADAIEAGTRSCPQVPGRIERVGAELDDAPTVFVDYAHTPDAVEKLLRTVRPLARNRLITVFGCGGDRDRAKRPLMAEAVARSSDCVVATSDNPRTEDPSAILSEVTRGLGALKCVEPDELGSTPAAYSVVPDRRSAIELAIGLASPDDTVVLAGKGHEDYQIVGRERLPFDDRTEAMRALRRRGIS